MCAACASRYYAAVDGSCAACPELSSPWARVSGFVYIAVGVIAVVGLVLGILVVVVVAVGGTFRGAAFRLVSVGVWTLTTAQAR